MGPVQEGSVITASLSPLKGQIQESFIERLLCTRTLYLGFHSRYKGGGCCTHFTDDVWIEYILVHALQAVNSEAVVHLCVYMYICVCVYYINACLCVDTERREDRIFVGNGGELLGDTCLSFRIDSLIWFKLVNWSHLLDSNSQLFHELMN